MASLVRAEDWQGEQSLEVVAATAEGTVYGGQITECVWYKKKEDGVTGSRCLSPALSAHVNKVPGRHC